MASPLEITILGCHSASPKSKAHPTSQVIDIRGHLFLIDCGEGTQVRLREHKVKFSRIKHIFISHLHGDHFFGLIGLISTFGLLNRQEDLHIYGPKGIKEIIVLQLRLSKSFAKFHLHFHELESRNTELIFEDEKVSVETIPLDHRVYTNGFLFKEKSGDRKLNIEKVRKYPISKAYYNKIKQGFDYTLDSGEVVRNEDLTDDPDSPKSYAFCSDTAFKPLIVEQIESVTALYHEATFLEQHEDLCVKTKHSTAKQAGIIAQKAQAKHLILGHYSARYKSLSQFKEEAQQVFDSVLLAQSGIVFRFD
ncbi:MAG: ribonuclease Z [Bacteroidota bacterium]